MATHSSILAWRIPGTEEPSGLPFMGLHRVGHDWGDLAAAAAAAAWWGQWWRLFSPVSFSLKVGFILSFNLLSLVIASSRLPPLHPSCWLFRKIDWFLSSSFPLMKPWQFHKSTQGKLSLDVTNLYEPLCSEESLLPSFKADFLEWHNSLQPTGHRNNLLLTDCAWNLGQFLPSVPLPLSLPHSV